MHWSRWGDPAEAGPLSESAFALVDAFIGTSETPAVDPAEVRLSEPLGQELLAGLEEIVGAEHVLTDHETRLHRTRGKSTPDLLRLRAGDGSDSPDAVVRPGTHDEVAALIDWCVSSTTSRWSPSAAAPRSSAAWSRAASDLAGVVSLDLIRFDRLLAVDTDSMTATLEPGLRGPQAEALAGRARPDAGPLPAVLRVRLDRRLRGHPLLGPVLRRATAGSTRSWSACGSRLRRASSCSATRRPTRPVPTCARW